MRRHFAAWSLAIVMPAWSLAADPGRVADPRPAAIDDRNAFSIDLLRRMAPAKGVGNVVISPHGASRVLAMAAEGGAGATAQEIRRAGRLPASPRSLALIDPSRPTTRPTLGARLAANGGYGIKVEDVFSASAAARAGLMAGDLILSINDRPVRSVNRISEALRVSGGESPVRVRVYAYESGKVVEKALTPDRVESPSAFTVRDAVFLQRGLMTRPEFRAALDVSFRAPIIPVDFAVDPASAAAEIRRWVESGSKPTPQPDLSAVDASAWLVLVDAVTFEAEWLQPFPPDSPGQFNRPDGSTIEVPMLERTDRYAIEVSLDGSSSLEIPYADRASALVLVLPRPGGSIRELVGQWKGGEIESRRAALKPRRVEVRLPRFRVEATNRLDAALAEMGMRLAFGPQADFSNVAATRPGRDGRIGLATILQSTSLEVTPKGTKAGTVTAATAIALGVEDAPTAFHADHPFAFFLIDLRTGLIVFEGIIEEPRPPS